MITATKTKGPLTHVQRVQCYITASMLHAMALMEMPHQCYCDVQFEYGMEYLELICEGHEGDVRRISMLAEYWGWWKLHWYKREIAFVRAVTIPKPPLPACYPLYFPKDVIAARWLATHNPNILAKANTNFGQDMEVSYAYDLIPVLNKIL